MRQLAVRLFGGLFFNHSTKFSHVIPAVLYCDIKMSIAIGFPFLAQHKLRFQRSLLINKFFLILNVKIIPEFQTITAKTSEYKFKHDLTAETGSPKAEFQVIVNAYNRLYIYTVLLMWFDKTLRKIQKYFEQFVLLCNSVNEIKSYLIMYCVWRSHNVQIKLSCLNIVIRKKLKTKAMCKLKQKLMENTDNGWHQMSIKEITTLTKI